MLHRTRGGSRETEEKLLTVIPIGLFSLSIAVTTVIPVGNIPNAFLKSLLFCVFI